MEKEIIAVIEIGSKSIRMNIAQVINNKIEILEELRQPIRIGKDTFNNGKISRQTIDNVIATLKKYKALCDEYKVKTIKTLATTALREASNNDIFIDNVKTYTSIEIEILPALKEILFVYKALIKIAGYEITDPNEIDCIIDLGAGSVELTIFNTKHVLFSRSLPIGALKLKQNFLKYNNSEEAFYKYFNIVIDNELRDVLKEVQGFKVRKIFGIGNDLNAISSILNNNKNDNSYIQLSSLEKFIKNIKNTTDEELANKWNIPSEYIDTFTPSCIILSKITQYLNSNKIITPNFDLQDAILEDMVHTTNSDKFIKLMDEQIRINAMNIGKKLNYNKAHAMKVLDFALKIFEETKDLHNLTDIEKIYLTVATILHDVGSSISNSAHHKHSFYIINVQEFFYLSDLERKVIANIARYHRYSPPKESHIDFMSLPEKEKIIVKKLSAILRIADSLDNSNTQVIEAIKIIRAKKTLTIEAYTKGDIEAEIYSLNKKKDIFEDFFGINVELIQKSNRIF